MSEKKTILIVDDTPENIKVLAHSLANEYRLIFATTGPEALELATTSLQPNLILLDIMMPGMDGYEVCRRLKADKRGQAIPIIFVTALGEDLDETRGLELGAVDYITKPFSLAIVKARVRTHIKLKDATDQLEQTVAERTSELEKAYKDLESSHEQILQQEKMACIGQLAAGVAHEINNPIGFISSNLHTLPRHIGRISEFIKAQSITIKSFADDKVLSELKNLRKKLKLDYVLEDVSDLVEESLEGTDRIIKIVKGLKSFSHKDHDVYGPADINEIIESTLNIIWNELKYTATVEKDYGGDLPITKCYSQQLSQVFMNLLINAGHAIEGQGVITIKTRAEDEKIIVQISDTGCGIAKENLQNIFEAFFTTKEVGKGTGLGLSITADIIKKHDGKIDVASEVGEGTTFTLMLPVKSPEELPLDGLEISLDAS